MPTFTLVISSFPLSHFPLFSHIFLFFYWFVFSHHSFFPFVFSHLSFCPIAFSLCFLPVVFLFSLCFLPSFLFFHHFPPESGVAAGAETRAPRGNQSAKDPCHNILFILQPFCKRANIEICVWAVYLGKKQLQTFENYPLTVKQKKKCISSLLLLRRMPTASLKTSLRTLVPTEGETLAPNLTRAAKNFLVLSINVSGFDDGPLNSLQNNHILSHDCHHPSISFSGGL